MNFNDKIHTHTHTTDERGVRELGASMLPLGSCTDSTDCGATCKISDIFGDFFKLGRADTLGSSG